MKVKRWNIFRANLDPTIGSEQGKSRPVLIISEDAINDLLNIVNILPITTRKKEGLSIQMKHYYQQINSVYQMSQLFYVTRLEQLIKLDYQPNMVK